MKLTQLHLVSFESTHLPAIPHAPDLEMIRAVSALSLTRPPDEERPLWKDNLILAVTAQQTPSAAKSHPRNCTVGDKIMGPAISPSAHWPTQRANARMRRGRVDVIGYRYRGWRCPQGDVDTSRLGLVQIACYSQREPLSPLPQFMVFPPSRVSYHGQHLQVVAVPARLLCSTPQP